MSVFLPVIPGDLKNKERPNFYDRREIKMKSRGVERLYFWKYSVWCLTRNPAPAQRLFSPHLFHYLAVSVLYELYKLYKLDELVLFLSCRRRFPRTRLQSSHRFLFHLSLDFFQDFIRHFSIRLIAQENSRRVISSPEFYLAKRIR